MAAVAYWWNLIQSYMNILDLLEKTIGFYDTKTRELKYSELVESESDIKRFYEKYGLTPTDK